MALIVASKGESLGLLSSSCLGPVVLVVVITTIITPILLKPVFKLGPAPAEITDEHKLADNYEQMEGYRDGSQK